MTRFLRKIDLLIFLPALLLSSVGLLMIYSTSYESDSSFFFRQGFYILLSVIIYIVISNLDFKTVSHFAIPLYVFLIIVLVMTLAVGSETRGSARWLNLGFANLQAAELAKPILVLALSSFFARYPPNSLKNFFLSTLVPTAPVILIALQPNLSNSFILSCLWVFMVFIAGANLLYLMATVGGFLLSVPFIWSFLLASYQKTRITAFFNPKLDPQGASYNTVQALIAFGSGQLTGVGFGRGTQSHLDFLPEGRTDFILAAAGEELGFIGVGLIVMLFTFLIYQILGVAKAIKGAEGSLFAYGCAFIIILQFFINAGMNMGIFPVSGVTLPFVSFGGSSMISMFILIGLLQSAKKAVKEV